MAKLKKFFTNLFSGFAGKTIIILSSIILLLLLFTNCSKVDAANFTGSEVTYNEGQMYGTSNTNVLLISNPNTYNASNFYVTNIKTAASYVYNITYLACKYTSTANNDFIPHEGYILCNNYYSVYNPNATSVSKISQVNYFYIYDNYVEFNDSNYYLIGSTYTDDDLENARQEGYDEGYIAGSSITDGYSEGYTAGVNSVDITQDNQTAINNYITENNYHSNDEYLDYGNTQYTAGVNSVDITQDNQTAINNYITENNYHSNDEYIAYGELEWKKGHGTGVSYARDLIVDSLANNTYDKITFETYDSETGNAQTNYNYSIGNNIDVIVDNYISNNNYHTNDDYLDYGNTQYTAGVNSVDITTDNESAYNEGYNTGFNEGKNSVDITQDNQTAINDYITENNYHSDSEYQQYGENQYNTGYANGESAGLTTGYNNGYSAGETAGYNNGYSKGNEDGYLNGYANGNIDGYIDGTNMGIEINTCNITGLNNTSALNCKEMIDFQNGVFNFEDTINFIDDQDYINGRFKFDITFTNYILPTNIAYGTTKSNTGTYIYFYDNDTLLYTYDFSNNQLNKVDYIDLSLHFSNGYNRIVVSNANYDYSILTFGLYDMNTFLTGNEIGTNKGYTDALKDSDAFLGFIPATLGGVISNVMPILTYEIYGLSIMNLIGLIAMIGIAIIIVKFIVG